MTVIPETRRSPESSGFYVNDPAANPASAHHLRQHFTRWVSATLTTSAQRRADIVLAVYEAVANVIQHAYHGLPQRGVVIVHAAYRPSTRSLRVTVADRGTWQQSQPSSAGGRGLPLINALCETPTISTGPAGTTVTLQWRLFS